MIADLAKLIGLSSNTRATRQSNSEQWRAEPLLKGIDSGLDSSSRDRRSYYLPNSGQMLFWELIDIRSRSINPRIFDLIESMGPHDKAFEPAFKAVVGIGGPDVLDQCKEGLKSKLKGCGSLD